MITVNSKTARSTWLIIILLLIAARVAAIFNDFWIDEIWTFEIVVALKSVKDILLNVHHDNNHYLNTFFSYMLHKIGVLDLARIPPLSASIILLLAIINEHKKRISSLITSCVLVGLSFPLIHFSTEARGYSFLFLFSYMAIKLFFAEKHSTKNYVLFHIAQIFGFLSHLSFSGVAASFGVAYFFKTLRSTRNPAKSTYKTFVFEIPSMLFVLFLFVSDISKIIVGGGPSRSMISGFCDLSDLFFSTHKALALILLLIVLTLLVHVYKTSRKQIKESFPFFVFAVLVAFALPVFNFIFSKFAFGNMATFPRYFVLNYFLFVYFLIRPCAKLLDSSSKQSRVLAITFLIIYGVCNIFNLMSFFEFGRGQYTKAINFILKESKENVIILQVEENRDLRVLNYYLAQIDTGNKVVLRGIRQSPLPPYSGDQWFLLGRVFRGYQEAGTLHLPEIGDMVLKAQFPSALFSGSSWMLYHKSYDNLE